MANHISLGAKPRLEVYSSLHSAIESAKSKKEPGLIWVLNHGTHKIVGNYDGKGGVWNSGYNQIVPASVEDLQYLAEHLP